MKPKKMKENSKSEKKFIIDKSPVYGYKKSFRNGLKRGSKVSRYQMKLDISKFKLHLTKRSESLMFKFDYRSGIIDDDDMKKLAKAMRTTNRIQRLEISCFQFDILRNFFLNIDNIGLVV